MPKSRRMALRADTMPEDVYQILKKKANSRQLTAYVVELVQKEKRHEQIINKLTIMEQRLAIIEQRSDILNTLENKLDILLTNGVILTPTQENKKNEEQILQEGKIIDAIEIIGGISEEDSEEMDF